MKDDAISGLAVVLLVALVAALGIGLWLIGAETLRVMGLILTVGLVAVGLTGALALVVRAWRKNDSLPIERQVVREVRETRILDGREPAPQSPAQAPFGVFPEMLRASYRAGLLSGREDAGEVVEAEVRQLPARDRSLWMGDIMP